MLTQLIILLAAIGGTGSLTALLTWLVLRSRPPRESDDDVRLLIARMEAVRRTLAGQSESNRTLVERVEFLERLLEGRELPGAADETRAPARRLTPGG